MTLPGKLVRDGIPAIIRKAGLVPTLDKVTPANRDEYIRMKLHEELAEYSKSGNIEELADIIEVCFAAAELRCVSRQGLLLIAHRKRLERGGFQAGIVWLGNETPT